MTPPTLNEREFELINIIGAELASNQRDLSRQMDLSLGMTNMLIRRLISKGYIRIQQLNKNKFQYILTPQGFSEKLRKSVKYTVKTINSLGLIKTKLKAILQKLYEQGERKFYVLGASDLVTLVEWTLKEISPDDCRCVLIKQLPLEKVEGLVLICQEDIPPTELRDNRTVDLLQELAQEMVFTNGGKVS